MVQLTHLLKFISDKFRKKSFCWATKINKAFNIMKITLAAAVLIAYSNHCILFQIYTAVSYYQTGTVIVQQIWYAAYQSFNVTNPKWKNNTMEKELLSIIVVLDNSASCYLVTNSLLALCLMLKSSWFYWTVVYNYTPWLDTTANLELVFLLNNLLTVLLQNLSWLPTTQYPQIWVTLMGRVYKIGL